MRSIFGLNPLAYLPQAIFYVTANHGSINGAKHFMWQTRWWAHIWGWFGTLGLVIATCSIVFSFQAIGFWYVPIAALFVDIVGWLMYYLYYHGAYRYANYLVQVGL